MNSKTKYNLVTALIGIALIGMFMGGLVVYKNLGCSENAIPCEL